MQDIGYLIDLVKWISGIAAALAAVLWAIQLWEIRALRKSMHDLRAKLIPTIDDRINWYFSVARQRRRQIQEEEEG